MPETKNETEYLNRRVQAFAKEMLLFSFTIIACIWLPVAAMTPHV